MRYKDKSTGLHLLMSEFKSRKLTMQSAFINICESAGCPKKLNSSVVL